MVVTLYPNKCSISALLHSASGGKTSLSGGKMAELPDVRQTIALYPGSEWPGLPRAWQDWLGDHHVRLSKFG